MTTNRATRIIWVGAVVIVVLLLVWFSRRVILLLFAGLLIALILSSLTNLLRKVLPVGHKMAFAIVLVLLAGIVWGTIMLIAPSIAEQFNELADRLPRLFSDFMDRVRSSAVYQRIQEILPGLKEMMPTQGGGKFTQVFSSTFEAISAFVFISFTALFLAASPGPYQRLVIRLFPPALRDKARETTSRVICTLKYWLLGQAVSMSVVGVVTGTALAIAGIPFAAALGILAGLAEFIPIVGPLFAAIPGLLVALSEGGNKFVAALIIYLVIQFFEGNLLMPLVQRKAIDLPPVITLLALFVLGGAFGLLGMFVAAPFAALTLVLIEDIYLRHYLKTDDKLLT